MIRSHFTRASPSRVLEDEIAGLDALGLSIREGHNFAFADGGLDQRYVGRLRVGKVGPAIDYSYVIVGGKPQRVLESGVSGPDDDNFLAFIFVRVIELILKQRKVGAGYGQLADVALDADRENDIFRGYLLAADERNLEIAAPAGDRRDLGIKPQVHLRALDIAGPTLDHLLPRLLLEGELAAQRQDFGRCHHMLAFLIFENRVVEMWRALEEDMWLPLFCSARSRAHAGWPRADDGNQVINCHCYLPTLGCSHQPLSPREVIKRIDPNKELSVSADTSAGMRLAPPLSLCIFWLVGSAETLGGTPPMKEPRGYVIRNFKAEQPSRAHKILPKLQTSVIRLVAGRHRCDSGQAGGGADSAIHGPL